MKLPLKNNGLTLLELLIALILTGIVAVSIFSLDIFGSYHLTGLDKRRRVQNQVSDVLEHISKNIINAVGNTAISGMSPVNISEGVSLELYVDRPGEGEASGDGRQGTGRDAWVAYHYDSSLYQIKYCSNYGSADCNADWLVIAKNISAFSPTYEAPDNFITVNIIGCWNAGEAGTCGSPDNPAVNMTSRFNMPSVAGG
ncbi:MAG: prepilin-type N-terminal cleavage/methylation domain-containing protein [Candidatus Omnitrophota bacterium]|jgi:prepilin-type N-terminal cleavage/methylation domain-containing protein